MLRSERTRLWTLHRHCWRCRRACQRTAAPAVRAHGKLNVFPFFRLSSFANFWTTQVLILIFAEALGLYGLIVAIILATVKGPDANGEITQ